MDVGRARILFSLSEADIYHESLTHHQPPTAPHREMKPTQHRTPGMVSQVHDITHTL